MAKTAHLIVVGGSENGREIHVPDAGVRIGRSSRNDISVADEAMSRFQCRFFFKPGGGLWVSDLGSANGTLVNGTSVQEQRLARNDEVVAGDTCFRVICQDGDAMAPDQGPREAGDGHLVPAQSVPEPPLDLGFKQGAGTSESGVSHAIRRKLIWVAGAMGGVVLLAWMPWSKLEGFVPWRKNPPPVVVHEVFPDLEVAFERVEGSVSNIFRYALEIKDDTLVVQVDDLQSNRHVRREKRVAPELLKDLAHSLESCGLFELRDDYAGLAPGIYEASDLSVTIGARTRRVKVVNHIEPDVFALARGIIEEFGKDELGLAALAIDPATLVDKAHEALLQGKKMWDEREVRDENLSKAIRAYKE